MRTHIDCFPCFIRQTTIALSQFSDNHALGEEVIKEVLRIVQSADTARPPAYTTTLIHRLIREKVGQDPFRKVKRAYNTLAMGLYAELKARIRRSEDPLWTASRLAISGNVIDFGIYTSIDIESSILRSLETHIAVDDYEMFREDLDRSEEILYLLDNAGEIVFDRLLIEELAAMGKKVRAAVKGSAVLNDVTSEDAGQTGLQDICEVIDNGSDAVGTILEWTSPEFRARYAGAELVISKGQGNFETLTGNGKKAYFLFQSKCDVVSKELGLSPGSMLLKKS
ncbi:MAG: ARMT1-like domain-containing protein [Nitrospiraceae bacterium]|nr:ARMT1-like domain-containing protein [Nitrospiraceae bacterium]